VLRNGGGYAEKIVLDARRGGAGSPMRWILSSAAAFRLPYGTSPFRADHRGPSATGRDIARARRAGGVGAGGVWETGARRPANGIRSFAIVTTAPNELCAELHNRMPAIIAPGDAGRPGSTKEPPTRRS